MFKFSSNTLDSGFIQATPVNAIKPTILKPVTTGPFSLDAIRASTIPNRPINIDRLSMAESSNNSQAVATGRDGKTYKGLHGLGKDAWNDVNNYIRKPLGLPLLDYDKSVNDPKVSKEYATQYLEQRVPQILRSQGKQVNEETKLAYYGNWLPEYEKAGGDVSKMPKNAQNYFKNVLESKGFQFSTPTLDNTSQASAGFDKTMGKSGLDTFFNKTPLSALLAGNPKESAKRFLAAIDKTFTGGVSYEDSSRAMSIRLKERDNSSSVTPEELAFAKEVSQKQTEAMNNLVMGFSSSLEKVGAETLKKLGKQGLEDLIAQKTEALNTIRETLSIHPAKPIMKYVSPQTGELPEVLGSFRQGAGSKSKFGIGGDTLVTEHGFNSPEEAQQAVQGYQSLFKAESSVARDIKSLKSVGKDTTAFRNAPTAPKSAPGEAIVPKVDTYPKATKMDEGYGTYNPYKGLTMQQEMKRVLKEKPAMIDDSFGGDIKKSEMVKFAKDNNLYYGEGIMKTGSQTYNGKPNLIRVVAKDKAAFDAVINAKNPYEEGLALGYKDLRTPDLYNQATKGEAVEPAIAKASKDINEQIIKKGFDELSPEQQAKFNSISYKSQSAEIAEALKTDYERLVKMATKGEEIPNNWNPQLLFNTVKNKALLDSDIATLKDLASSPIATERSLAAQTLGASGFDNGIPNDPVSAMSEVALARQKNARVKDVDKAKTQVAGEIKKSIPKIPKETWSSFVDSLVC